MIIGVERKFGVFGDDSECDLRRATITHSASIQWQDDVETAGNDVDCSGTACHWNINTPLEEEKQ